MTDELRALAAQVLDQYPGPEHASLQALIVALLDLVDSLANRVAELEAEAGRHSGNSSKPPSGDTLAQRQAQKARRQEWTNKGKEKRSKGKQPGAPGAHLAQVEVPDVTVPHAPERCAGCGASLADAEVVATETRQVFDIPTPKIVVTAHVVETRRCLCGCESTGEFPPEATAPAVYGPVVSGVGTYLLAHQHLPVARTAEALADLVGMEVSTGWVSGLLPKAKGLLEHFLVDLRYRLMASPVMANDETGAKVDTERFWFHAATTETLTLITCHKRRGHIGMEAAGVLPEFKGVSVHDRYAQYWRFGCQHSACHAHLIRDLAAVAERASQEPWAEAMAKLLLDAKDEAEKARAAGRTSLSRRRLKAISAAYDAIVIRAIRANPDPWLLGREKRTQAERESWNLALAFKELKAEILLYCKNLSVWFTSNIAERGFRMIKIHS
ncbi:MAG TPA: IS66 family transposase, partial [Actinomycetota bacterium]|nr:IS66 family transposase [Actinomycetota bacterium]